MNSIDLFPFLMSVLIVGGSIACALLWLKNLLDDVGTNVTGIWVNNDRSFRVLIYNMDSVIQGDVVWTKTQNKGIIGQSILQNVRLNFFLFGKGKYRDPFTSMEYDFRLRVLSKDSLQLYLMDKEGKMVENETWNLVK